MAAAAVAETMLLSKRCSLGTKGSSGSGGGSGKGQGGAGGDEGFGSEVFRQGVLEGGRGGSGGDDRREGAAPAVRGCGDAMGMDAVEQEQAEVGVERAMAQDTEDAGAGSDFS